MKTVYLLIGGKERADETYGQRLSDVLAKYVERPKILSCFFASPPEIWERKSADWGEWFKNNLKVGFSYERANAETFLQQIDNADVIYIHGGTTELLLKFKGLPSADELKQHFHDKIIIGSSAGANMLAKNYWSSSRGVPGKGLGILNKNVMAHYGSTEESGYTRSQEDWRREEAEFQKYLGPQAKKIIRLAEAEILVLEQERTVVVNEQDEVIGAKDRNCITASDIYRVSGLWIKNSAGDVLLAQRKHTKSQDPGRWGPAVAGTVEEGETYYSNIVKEAEEEIGLRNIKPKAGPKLRVPGKYNHWVQTYVLVVDKPIGDFKIQEEEVEKIRWFKRSELEADLRKHPDKYLDTIKWALEEL